jgi:hypothetical protein
MDSNHIHAVAEAVAIQVARTLGEAVVIREWMAPGDVFQYCGISKQRLEFLRRNGGGPAYSMRGDKTVRYRRTDIDAWLLDGMCDGNVPRDTRRGAV